MIHRPGGYDRLSLEEHPPSPPGRDETLIDVRAVGVNYADCVTRMGVYDSARTYVGYPMTPGFEVAGIERASGRRVLAVTRFGGYATELAVPQSQVFPLPDALSMEQGAALPTVFLTAWYALCELARLKHGMSVVIHSAAGGVGGAMAQLACLAGCRVIGVVGAPHKVRTAREFGDVEVIDKSRDPLWTRVRELLPEGAEVICDANGARSLRQSYAHLAPTGKLIVYGFHTMLPKRRGRPSWLRILWTWLQMPRFDPLRMTRENRSVLAFNLSYLFERRDMLAAGMGYILDQLGRGDLRPPPVTVFPFEEAGAAHAALESGTTVGKLVLTPSET